MALYELTDPASMPEMWLWPCLVQSLQDAAPLWNCYYVNMDKRNYPVNGMQAIMQNDPAAFVSPAADPHYAVVPIPGPDKPPVPVREPERQPAPKPGPLEPSRTPEERPDQPGTIPQPTREHPSDPRPEKPVAELVGH